MTKFITGIILILISLSGFSQQHLIGKKAPEIKINKWNYSKIQVENWQTKEVPKDLNGRVIVLDLWFTKCAPCVASIPELNNLAKLYPEIVFLSITFEDDTIINEFLNRMIMYYPVGSYPEDKIVDEYGICGYPTTFLIDEKGIIQWVGSPFGLSTEILDKTLGKEVDRNINISMVKSEMPTKNSAYNFTIKEHELGMNEASYTHSYPFDINIFNKSLESLIMSYYKINKTRIISTDSAFLNTKYDITLKADKEVTTDWNCVPMLKFLLKDNLGFSIKPISIDTTAYNINIVVDSLLNNHKSDYLGFGTWNRVEYMDLKGATLAQLKDFIENHFNVITNIETSNTERFDFFIPIANLTEAKSTLFNDYGITIEPHRQKVEFWEIEQIKK